MGRFSTDLEQRTRYTRNLSFPSYGARIGVKPLRLILGLALFLLLGFRATPAAAQYIYLDSDGDGIFTSQDQLPSSGSHTVDIWLDTNHWRDGTLVSCPGGGDRPMNSYEFILSATGGTISWGSYSNAIAVMSGVFGPAADATQYYVGAYGATVMAAGKYKLGSLNLTIASGRPSIDFVTRTDLTGTYMTSFGSTCAGSDGDNTLKLGLDWDDSDGLPAAGSVLVESEDFEVNVVPGSTSYATDENPTGGYTYWGVVDTSCAIAHGFVARSVAASGNADAPGFCFEYDDDQDALLTRNFTLNMAGYESFSVTYWVWVATEPIADRFTWSGGSASDLGDPLATMSGYSSGWILIQHSWDNATHAYDDFYMQFRFHSDDAIAPAGGVWIDDIRIRAIPRPSPGQINLRPYLPPAWPAPIVVSPQSGDHEAGPLIAGLPMYIDIAIINDSDVTAPATTARWILNGCIQRDYGVPSLAPHEEWVTEDIFHNGTCAYPSGSSENAFVLLADAENAVYPEANEEDNAYTANYYIAPPPPNLKITEITISNPSPSIGDTVTVTAKVWNFSYSDMLLGCQVGLYKNRATPPTAGETPDLTKSIPPLEGDTFTLVTFTVTGTAIESWDTYVMADWNDTVSPELEVVSRYRLKKSVASLPMDSSSKPTS
jgi:hypothetical protein